MRKIIRCFLLTAALCGAVVPESMAQSIAEKNYDEYETIDEFVANETDHNLKGVDYTVGDYNGGTYIYASKNTGWFSYDMKPAGNIENMALVCKLWLKDTNRANNLYVDGVPVAERFYGVKNEAAEYDARVFPIPAALLLNADGTVKEKITVKVTGYDGKDTHGFYGFKLTKASQVPYRYVASEFESCDANRAPADKVIANVEDNTIEVGGSTTNDGGLHNIALKFSANNKYYINANQNYLVVAGRGFKTDGPASNHALWWLNGFNRGGSMEASWQFSDGNGMDFVVWELRTGRDPERCRYLRRGNCVLSNFGHEISTCFGITSGRSDGSATITDLSWLSVGEIVEKYPALAVHMGLIAFDEGATDGVTLPETAGKVGMKRALKGDKWNTFCVPFNMSLERLRNNGIYAVKALAGVTKGKDTYTLNFEDADTVEAGKPYIVKAVSGVTNISMSRDVTASAAVSPLTVNGITMTGSYNAMSVLTGAYFINDNVFYLADAGSNVSMKGFRAYIGIDTPSEEAGVNRMLIGIDDEVTAVEEVFGDEMSETDGTVDVYTLSGVCVKHGVKRSAALDGLGRGLYIVGRKKMAK